MSDDHWSGDVQAEVDFVSGRLADACEWVAAGHSSLWISFRRLRENAYLGCVSGAGVVDLVLQFCRELEEREDVARSCFSWTSRGVMVDLWRFRWWSGNLHWKLAL